MSTLKSTSPSIKLPKEFHRNYTIKKNNVALIGLGKWGKNILRILLNQPSIKISICDPLIKTNPYPDDTRIKIATMDEILNNEDIKSVFIVTPAATHYEITKNALNAKKNVFVEKPFTLDSEQASELSKLAKENGLILMVGLILEYHPVVEKLQELVATKELGNIYYLSTNRTNLGSVRTDTGVLWDLAIHDIDLACFLLKEYPLSVNAWNNSFISKSHGDIINIQLYFSKNIVVNIFTSWLDPLKRRELVIVGDKKMALFNDTQSSQKLAIIDRGIDIESPSFNSYGEFHFHYRYGDIVYPYIELQEPLQREINHFFHCVEEKMEPITSGTKTVPIIKILEATQKSAQMNGKTIIIN